MLKIKTKLKNVNFIDLFSGIGGFRLALESFGANCVFSSEIDQFAVSAYTSFFKDTPKGDITKIDEKTIPDFDILCAGFPCQKFSIAGKQEGFTGSNGTLFFDIIRILEHKKPSIVLLENVKNLARHDGGKTLSIILKELNRVGYDVYYKILNSKNFGVPQNRERIYFVCFLKKFKIKNYTFPTGNKKIIFLKDIIDFTNLNGITKSVNLTNKTTPIETNKPIQIGYVAKGRQGERIYHTNGIAITQTASGGGVGGSTGLYLINNIVRKLTIDEMRKVMGFPSKCLFPNIRNSQKCLGNAVVPNVIQLILKSIITQCQVQLQLKVDS